MLLENNEMETADVTLPGTSTENKAVCEKSIESGNEDEEFENTLFNAKNLKRKRSSKFWRGRPMTSHFYDIYWYYRKIYFHSGSDTCSKPFKVPRQVVETQDGMFCM